MRSAVPPRVTIQTERFVPPLGTPVVPFFLFYLGVSLLKLNSSKKGALIINVLLDNLGLLSKFCRGFAKHRILVLSALGTQQLGIGIPILPGNPNMSLSQNPCLQKLRRGLSK